MAGAPFYDTTDPEVRKALSMTMSTQYVAMEHVFLRPGSPYAGINPKGSMPVKAVNWDMDLARGNGGGGDQITHYMSFAIKHRGAAGREPLAGQGADSETATHSYKINVFRGAVRANDVMDKQRVPFDVVKNKTFFLMQWCSRRTFFAALAHMAGYEGLVSSNLVDDANLELDFSEAPYNINNAIRASAPACVTWANQSGASNDQTVDGDASAVPTKAHLDTLYKLIRQRRHPLRPPIMINGQPVYPMLVDEDVLYKLWSDSNFSAIATNLLQGGYIEKNPLLTGATTAYRGFVFFPITRGLPLGFNSSTKAAISTVRRCIVMGVDALNIAPGLHHTPENLYDLVTETTDLGAKKEWAASTILGMVRPQFTDPNDSTLYDPGVHVWVVKVA